MKNKMLARKKNIFGALLIFALTNIAVVGQIKIPKIFKPKQIPPVQTPQTPTNPGDNRRDSGGQPETLSQPGGNYIDDGFTWFEAVSTQELNAQHRPVTTGWALDSRIRLVGDYPKRTAVKVNISRAGKVLAATRCEMDLYDTNLRQNKVRNLQTIVCVNKTTPIKDLGKFDIEIVAVNGETDAETSVRNYKIEVFKVDRIGGGFSNPQPDAPHYYISRHAEAPVSFLFFRPADTGSYILGQGFPTWNGAEIYFSLSPTEKGKLNNSTFLQCTVDGKPQNFGDGRTNDMLDNSVVRSHEVIYTDRLAPQYQRGGPFQDDISFKVIRVALPIHWKADRQNYSITDHPGKWECNMMSNGEIWRTWRFQIGADGMPVLHPEQKNGNVKLFFNSYLIDMEIPAGGTVLDKRLVANSLSEGFFYGQKWTTPEGKAMAGRVPTKGNPHPVPSNKIK